MREKIKSLLPQLSEGLVDREPTIKAALLTLLAGENLVLIGPPGTAKSLVARRITQAFNHGKQTGYFEYLLTKFSTPEELFGPLSITELKADRYKRNTAGYLPTVRVAFLDEIFKASSSILNALLTILNERLYHNGPSPEAVPLLGLIAASNELPAGQQELDALYDRFLVRSFVDYVGAANLSKLFGMQEMPHEIAAASRLSDQDIAGLHERASNVGIPTEVQQAIQSIWREHKEAFKEDARERLSDRRLVKALKLLRISASSNGRDEADLSDALLLKDCLWNHPDNRAKVQAIILSNLRKFSRLVSRTGRDMPDAVSPINVDTSVMGAVVKGFKGRGTAEDPLLIETLQDLMDLDHPEVGQKGYHFRQTADIDCSGVTHWQKMSFKGHYDGTGHAIKGATSPSSPQTMVLFEEILSNSSILCLKLRGLALARSASGSTIKYCESTENLIDGNAKKCDLTSCSASNWIAKSIQGSTISQCTANRCLISEKATNSKIYDCHLAIEFVCDRKDDSVSGIAQSLEGGIIERCLVTGKADLTGAFRWGSFYGIANSVDESSQVSGCVVGPIKIYANDLRGNRIYGRSSSKICGNNFAHESRRGNSDPNGPDGKTIAAIEYSQRYFERLGWNFETVWQWNSDKNHPELRTLGASASAPSVDGLATAEGSEDLLLQQCSANIWL